MKKKLTAGLILLSLTLGSVSYANTGATREKLSVDLKRTPTLEISNIAYKQVPAWFGQTKKNLEFTMITPNNAEGKKLPLVVWLSGGSWKMMDRAAFLPEFKYLADAGYIVAGVDYRLSNESQFPTQVEDIKSAIRYFRKHADEYGIDKDRIAIMGASAGGHLALLSAYTHETKEYDVGDNLDETSYVKAVVDFYGPTIFDIPDAVQGDAKFYLLDLINMVGTEDFKDEKFKKMAPVHNIGKKTQPTIIFHGNADDTVPFEQSQILYEKLKENNIYTEFYEIDGAGHGTDEFFQDDVNNRVLKFLEKFL